MTDSSQVLATAKQCGDVQILVNNAGVLSNQPLIQAADTTAAQHEMAVNYFGTLAMCRSFAAILGRNGGGAIVNVLSISGCVNIPIVGSYSASKAAARSLTQGIRAELASQKTLVVGIFPGFVDTEMIAHVTLPKLPKRAVADSVIDALRTGAEDVYPGAEEIAHSVQQDLKGTERQFAAFKLPG